MRSVLALVCVLGVAFALASDDDLGTFKLLHRVVDKCSSHTDMYSCLKLKAVGLMDRALTVDTLPLNDYVSIHRDPKAKLDLPAVKSEQELEAALPKEQDKRSLALDEMLEDRVNKYMDTRTIQLSMPTDTTEGRKKKDKGGMMMMAAAAMGGMMLQMAMGKIALIAGKALLIGKVALLLSAIIGLKKLVGGGGGESHHPQVVYASGGGHHDGWGRSTFELAEAAAANDLAYLAYRPRS